MEGTGFNNDVKKINNVNEPITELFACIFILPILRGLIVIGKDVSVVKDDVENCFELIVLLQ